MFNCITDNVKGCLILQLLWSDTLMRRAFFVLQPYLTDVWRLSFTHAAAIVNIWEGTSLMLPAVFQFVADKYLGNFKVVVLSTISSTLGVALVTMSLPPVLGLGHCKEYDEKCVSGDQKGLLYLGVALTAVGRGGLSASVPCLHDDQGEAGQFFLCGFVQRHGSTAENLLVYAVGLVIISVISSWTFRFGFPAIFAGFVTLSFLGRWPSYKKAGPKRKGSLLAALYKAFASPRSRRNNGNENEAGREESSFLRHIAAISVNFIILGVVSALGNTFFVEQANHMNRKFLFLTLPLALFQLPMLIAAAAAPCLLAACLLLRCLDSYASFILPKCLRSIPSLLGVAAAFAHALLCCAAAAAVEARRHGGPGGAVVGMHATWLVFQFYLVACVDVFFRSSIEAYYHARAPGALRDYYGVYTDFVTGFGYFGSVVLVGIVGRVSDWFGETVDRSRLDRYYWVLAVLAGMSLVGFCVMAPFCICKPFAAVAASGGGPERDGEGERSSCCFWR